MALYIYTLCRNNLLRLLQWNCTEIIKRVEKFSPIAKENVFLFNISKIHVFILFMNF